MAENYIVPTMFYLPHSAPRDFIMVSTPDLAHALGTTKPDPFKQQFVKKKISSDGDGILTSLV